MSGRPLVYVVDDEEPIRGALRVLLRGAGYAVATCSSGTEALSAIERERPACVLTDYHMPGMDGRELIEAIRRMHPGVPVVLMSGRDESSQLDRIENVPVIAKPFDAKVLLETLHSMIQSHAAR
jgi:CheY-like chemotaxis protein